MCQPMATSHSKRKFSSFILKFGLLHKLIPQKRQQRSDQRHLLQLAPAHQPQHHVTVFPRAVEELLSAQHIQASSSQHPGEHPRQAKGWKAEERQQATHREGTRPIRGRRADQPPHQVRADRKAEPGHRQNLPDRSGCGAGRGAADTESHHRESHPGSCAAEDGTETPAGSEGAAEEAAENLVRVPLHHLQEDLPRQEQDEPSLQAVPRAPAEGVRKRQRAVLPPDVDGAAKEKVQGPSRCLLQGAVELCAALREAHAEADHQQGQSPQHAPPHRGQERGESAQNQSRQLPTQHERV